MWASVWHSQTRRRGPAPLHVARESNSCALLCNDAIYDPQNNIFSCGKYIYIIWKFHFNNFNTNPHECTVSLWPLAYRNSIRFEFCFSVLHPHIPLKPSSREWTVPFWHDECGSSASDVTGYFPSASIYASVTSNFGIKQRGIRRATREFPWRLREMCSSGQESVSNSEHWILLFVSLWTDRPTVVCFQSWEFHLR